MIPTFSHQKMVKYCKQEDLYQISKAVNLVLVDTSICQITVPPAISFEVKIEQLEVQKHYSARQGVVNRYVQHIIVYQNLTNM